MTQGIIRKQFRVWDKVKEKMLYDGFIMRSGNPPVQAYYDMHNRYRSTGSQLYRPEVLHDHAEPLEEPTVDQRERINEVMDDPTACYSLVDWSNHYYEHYVEMQTTGMHDRDGRLIWEYDLLSDGDIVYPVIWYYCNYIWNGQQVTEFRDFDDYGNLISENSYEGDRFGLETKTLFKVGNFFEDGLRFGFDWKVQFLKEVDKNWRK